MCAHTECLQILDCRFGAAVSAFSREDPTKPDRALSGARTKASRTRARWICVCQLLRFPCTTWQHHNNGGANVPHRVRKELQEIEPLLLKIPEAARLLNCSPRHIDDLAAQGLLEKRKLDHAVRITMASVKKLAAAE